MLLGGGVEVRLYLPSMLGLLLAVVFALVQPVERIGGNGWCWKCLGLEVRWVLSEFRRISGATREYQPVCPASQLPKAINV